MTDSPRCLASYGTLAPGESNHDQLSGLQGRWFKGTVRGHRTVADWGQWIGYPGFRLDPDAAPVEMHIFESDELPSHWDRLDSFEGEAYQRVATMAQTEAGQVELFIYELKKAPD